MPSREAIMAIQFDKATLGMTLPVMRDQILSNAAFMYEDNDAHHPIRPPSYNIILSEQVNSVVPILHYRAAVICSSIEGVSIVLQGKKEATIWAAYRDLLRITMKEAGEKMSRETFRDRNDTEGAGGKEMGVTRIGLGQSKGMRVLGIGSD